MRIAWVTPSHAESAIAAYSREVVGALRRHAEVDLWSASSAGAPEGHAPDVTFGELPHPDERLPDYDVVVYNLGDNLRYHGDIVRLSRRHPGVLVLHDRSMVGLFVPSIGVANPLTSLDEIELLYGDAGRALSEDLLAGRIGSRWAESDMLLRLPFTEPALVGHRGAIVHSFAHARDVESVWPGPVATIPFPTYPHLLAAPSGPSGSERDRVTLLTVGMVNPNKHVHDVIEVLACDRRLATRVRYLVAGPAPLGAVYPRELSAQIHRHGLRATVKLLGRQPRAAFNRILSSADVYVNLRFPALEGGSASAAEQLAGGRPLLVYDVGSYAELPSSAALKLPPADRDALASALWRLVDRPELRTAMGAAARREAERRHLDNYARALLDFLTRLPEWPWRQVQQNLERTLAEMGMGVEMPVHVRVGRELALLLSERMRSGFDAG